MPTVEEKIESALFGYVDGIELTNDVPMALPNLAFPSNGIPSDKPETYVEVNHLPNSNTRLFIKGTNPHMRQGILQFRIVTPLNTGHTAATAIAGEIAELFPADLTLYEEDIKVMVQQAPSVSLGSRSTDQVSWDALVSIRYDCFF